MHARSIVASAIDGATGEATTGRLGPDHDVVIGGIMRLASQLAVTYEVGPTGYGLCRALTAAKVDCAIAAPSKLRPGR